jgi:hypothetical protein
VRCFVEEFVATSIWLIRSSVPWRPKS